MSELQQQAAQQPAQQHAQQLAAQLLAQPKIALVAHDAGGAEILSAACLQQPHWQPLFVLAGPAVAIFQRKLGQIQMCDLAQTMAQVDWLLTGTGWQSELEWQAIKLAKAAGKPVVAFLDHWVNYRERFVRHGQNVLPDQLWVGDAAALELARSLFPTTAIILQPNPYFAEIQASFAALAQSQLKVLRDGTASGDTVPGAHLLFVCEPIAAHAQQQFGNARHWGYTEMDALAYFLAHLERIAPKISQITIRPHPSEEKDKYAALIQQSSLPIRLGGELELKQEIAQADIVCGCNSMALVIAWLAKKRLVCCIPPAGPASSLPPLVEMTMLRDLP